MQYINHPPADHVGIFRAYNNPDGESREYLPIPISSVIERIDYALDSQTFDGVKYLLIQTAEAGSSTGVRYYPLPLLLRLSTPLPHFAHDAMERVMDALESHYKDSQ